MFYSWLSTGIAIVNKKSLRNILDAGRDDQEFGIATKINRLFLGPCLTPPKNFHRKSVLKFLESDRDFNPRTLDPNRVPDRHQNLTA